MLHRIRKTSMCGDIQESDDQARPRALVLGPHFHVREEPLGIISLRSALFLEKQHGKPFVRIGKVVDRRQIEEPQLLLQAQRIELPANLH